ncbi:MAG: thiolase family protein [Boseongicola sp. SB0662_bin_57]|nr:thiolase family protein [Boseongicola sp. SB0662_bin_57]
MTVCVAGGAMTPFNRRKDGSSWRDWCRDAFAGALADAGLERSAVDALVVASESDFFTLQLNPASMVADTLGLLGCRSCRVEGGGASGHLAVHAGMAMVLSGQSRRVAVVGVEASATHLDGRTVGVLLSHSFDSWTDGFTGTGSTSIYALSVMAFMERTKATANDLARVAVRNRQNARANPNAHLPLDIREEDVAASPLVSSPYRRLDCSPLSDGAACVILGRPEDLPATGRGRVRISGTGAANDRARLGDRSDPGRFRAKEAAARRALAAAGITADAIGVAEVYDSYSGAQLQALEALGLASDVVADERSGRFARRGDLPVNLSGGLLGQGAPVGATGVAQVLVTAQQLLGSFPGLNPRSGPRCGLVDSHGGIATNCAVSILELQ